MLFFQLQISYRRADAFGGLRLESCPHEERAAVEDQLATRIDGQGAGEHHQGCGSMPSPVGRASPMGQRK